VEALGLGPEQTTNLTALLASRGQAFTDWLADVLMEYGIGRVPGRDYAPPVTALHAEGRDDE
jgi:hypothetical protein